MKKIIYTAIIGNYDILRDPKIITPGWEYICFTDNHELRSNFWQIIYLNNPYNIDKIRHARSIKIDYPRYLPEHDLSIWVDGSIEIMCDLNDFVTKTVSKDIEMVIMKHPQRDNIIDEAATCVRILKANANDVKEQMNSYLKDGYNFKNGLVASGLIIRKNTTNIEEFCKKWYSQVKRYTSRDQLSFNYVLYKHPLSLNLIPYNIIHSETEFKLHAHVRS